MPYLHPLPCNCGMNVNGYLTGGAQIRLGVSNNPQAPNWGTVIVQKGSPGANTCTTTYAVVVVSDAKFAEFKNYLATKPATPFNFGISRDATGAAAITWG